MAEGGTSLAAQAVAMGPASGAPPSFDGHGWLVVINLAVFTGVTIIGAMIAKDQVMHIWRNRHRDFAGHPVTIWRWTGFCLATGIALRSGVAAAALWIWNPADPVGTGFALTLQRFVDPIAMAFGLTAMLLFVLAAKGMVKQLRQEPLAVDIWLSLPMLKRPAFILVASIMAAAGVVYTR